MYLRVNIRLGRVGGQDDLLNGNDIRAAIGLAELERILPGHVEVIA